MFQVHPPLVVVFNYYCEKRVSRAYPIRQSGGPTTSEAISLSLLETYSYCHFLTDICVENSSCEEAMYVGNGNSSMPVLQIGLVSQR